MKRIVSLMSIAAFAAVALVSCNKEVERENVEVQDPAYSYTFAVANGDVENADADTKSLLGSDANGMFLQWESTDKLNTWALYTGGEGAYSYNNTSTVDASTNPVTFTIVSYRALAVDDPIYAMYPYTGSSSTTPTADMTIPATQTQTGTSFNASAMPMVAEPFGISAAVSAKGSNNETSKVHFYNLGSIVEFDIYSPTGAYSTENIESVSFTSTSNIAGTFSFDLTTVDESNLATSLSLAGKSYSAKSVKTNVTSLSVGTATSVANAKKVYMVLAPGSYTGTVVLKTDIASYEYTISSAKEFQRATVKRLGLNLESATCTRVDPHPVGEVFIPATSIAAGDKILITSGNTGSISVMGYQKSNNRDAVSYTSDGSIISTSDMYPMVVAAGTTNSSYYTLYDSDEGGYLAATASGNNYLKTNADVSVDTEWEIELDGTGKATTFKATGSSNRNVMQFNSGSSLFSCYSSASQSSVYVFKRSTATVVSAANQDIAYSVTSVTIDYNVYNASGSTTVAFNTNPGSCASNLAINEGTKKVTFDITANTGTTRAVKVDITNNGVTKTVTINQAAAPTKLVMSTITATPYEDHIVFSWTEVSGATGYAISTNNGSTYSEPQVALSYDWTGLSALTDYTIYIKAIGDGGIYYLDSDPASKASTTLAPTLSLPASFTWTKASKTISWTDPNTGAGTYGTDYKYVYTLDDGLTTSDATSSTTAVLSIAATTNVKIKAVALTASHQSSAFSSNIVCTVGDALAGIPVSWPITAGTAPTITSNTFNSTATSVGTATLKLCDSSGTAQTLTTTTASSGTGVYNSNFAEDWYWLFAIPVENLKSTDTIKLQAGLYNNASQTYKIYYSTDNSTWTDTEQTIAQTSTKSTAVKNASFTTTNIAGGTLYIKLVGGTTTSSRLVKEIGFTIVAD